MITRHTGATGTSTRLVLFLGSVGFTLFLSTACVTSGFTGNTQESATIEPSRTRGIPESGLTESHGAEVSAIIEHFELEWFSLEAHRHPSILSELATGPYLNLGWEEEIYDEPFWLVITSAEVVKIHVLKYDSENFEAVASVNRTFDKTTTEGTVLESSLPAGICGVYVFVNENDTWKLATFFLMLGTPNEIERDWKYEPDWSKEIIGELPSPKLCEW
jgi:hypothetical protein